MGGRVLTIVRIQWWSSWFGRDRRERPSVPEERDRITYPTLSSNTRTAPFSSNGSSRTPRTDRPKAFPRYPHKNPLLRAWSTLSSSRERYQSFSYVQSLSYREMLHQRLQKYQWELTFSIDCIGPNHALLWKASLFLGSTKRGESTWFTNKDAAKEEAAMRALEWLNVHGYH